MRAVRPECNCAYIRQITSAHATTDIFYLGDTPASVGSADHFASLFILTSIMVNDVRATTNP